MHVQQLDAQNLPSGIDRIEADRNPSADIDGVDDVRVDADVAIIDSGIDGDHPDLNVAGGVNFGNGPSRKWKDGSGHGSHVAGTVGALDNGFGVVGVAPGVRVWAVRVCGNSGFCFTDDMVAGIDWVAARKQEYKNIGGSPGINFAVANMSISTNDDSSPCDANSDAVHTAICGLVNEGVVFSLSAGNDNRVKNAYPEVLAVSALSDFDGRGGGIGSPTCRTDEDESLANFSNFGPEVDIAAPGVCILSTWKDGAYNTISGTSMASPHVTGAVALYLHANGLAPATDAASVDAIEQAILNAALPQSDPCGFTNEFASNEPLLFVNATAFGGDGTCDDGSGPVNDPPVVTITDPAAGSGFASGETITFQGSASDTEDGDLTANLVWTSNIDSQIGASGSFSTTLSDGTHMITAEVTDSGGKTGSDAITITVGSAPGVTVTQINPNSMQADTSVDVTISGTGFAAGPDVTFENANGPAPTASNIVFVDANTITCTVTAPSGGPPRPRVWDVRVTNTDGSTGVLADGFTVTTPNGTMGTDI
ncbi:S8 family serine peptidase [candidate division KSB1 bacterium]|nr:S8 family serine peptidase [candidate division KSB1 bacterium]